MLESGKMLLLNNCVDSEVYFAVYFSEAQELRTDLSGGFGFETKHAIAIGKGRVLWIVVYVAGKDVVRSDINGFRRKLSLLLIFLNLELVTSNVT